MTSASQHHREEPDQPCPQRHVAVADGKRHRTQNLHGFRKYPHDLQDGEHPKENFDSPQHPGGNFAAQHTGEQFQAHHDDRPGVEDGIGHLRQKQVAVCRKKIFKLQNLHKKRQREGGHQGKRHTVANLHAEAQQARHDGRMPLPDVQAPHRRPSAEPKRNREPQGRRCHNRRDLPQKRFGTDGRQMRLQKSHKFMKPRQ